MISSQNPTHKIRNPRGVPVIAGLSLIIGIHIFRMLKVNQAGILTWIEIGVLIPCFVVVAVTLYWALKPASRIRIGERQLVVNGREIKADEIKEIMVRGYFNPIIGIKPVGKRIVPIKLCFRFLDEKGMKELADWAERNQVAFSYKHFMSWI
ncbi:hypothetical protein [Paenibacillus contaminans]|uniref:Uncharacterized protein n=1 Tax=Paenibacillus contaminans TaxID=450362 RepID=A0A329LP52_9BACL|nr:hypothetical protein [Paenibacillus contaminans]RAV09765.1 hypothetical protein DQG23_38995 [Paenibacillus contaminans]